MLAIMRATNLLTSFAAVLVTISFAPVRGRAEDPTEVLPAHARDPSIQSPAKFFGFEVGSRHLRHDQVVDYLRYLEAASPRVQVIDYAKSHGQRPLMVAAISSPANIEQLDKIQSKRRRLTSGRYQADLSEELLVMYMGYCVHGDEASAMNATPLVAYHLASSKSAEVAGWLENGVYLVDPALNPDGADRFANWSNENRGKFASASSADREHNQPWPGGRTNYYWFDLNRDWLPLVHPESQGRIALFHKWKPNVVLDYHEMSGTSSYFFQPGIPARSNPLSPSKNLQLTRLFAKEHSATMDAAGELYYTEERFDDFYPGKGSTYPDLHGAIGILFEQGSTRGLRLKNARTDRHFEDTVANQLRTSLSSLTAANQHKQALLQYQRDFYNNSLQQAEKSDIQAYILTGTTSRIQAAARLLRRHQIVGYQPTVGVRLDGKQHHADQILVLPIAQSETIFLQSLMEPLQNFRENIFYDVSAWHVPSAFDLEMHRWESDLPDAWTQDAWSWQQAKPQAVELDEGTNDSLIGYVFSPVELEAPRLVASLQRSGGHIRVAMEPMTIKAVGENEVNTWPRGSFVLLKQPNENHWSKLSAILRKQAATSGIEVAAVASGITPVGPDLGSNTLVELPTAKPLLVVGSGTRSYSSGALWHYLDTRLRMAATLVEDDRLVQVDLREYSTVILPSGTYGNWGRREASSLKDYLSSGGTVIAIASAIRWLEREELLTHEHELEQENNHASGSKRPTFKFGDARRARALETVAGVFFRSKADLTNPVAFGFPNATIPLFKDHSMKFETPSNPYSVVARYEGVIAGYVSQRNREHLRGTPAVWVQNVGVGRIICIADNPVFRGYVRSAERFLTNAILLGPTVNVPSSPLGERADEDAHTH